MKSRGESLAAIALCGFLAVSTPVLAEPSYARATKYNLDISGADLTTALPALSRQTGVVVLYPFALAQVRSNPVKGLYTVPEALQLMLRGTGFSGEVTAQGAVSISRRRRRCDTGEEAMLRDSKSTVSVVALLASLFTYPVCAQPASGQAGGGQDAQDIAFENVVVTGSRVIQDAAQSPTPLTIVSTQQLLETTPSNLMDGLNKLPVFQNSLTRRNAGNAGGNNGGSFLNLRNFGQQRTLVLLDGMRLPASGQNGAVDISILPQTLISRVDVVTGGASAVYGSDAVTGVVNFIVDKNFNGVKYDLNAGLSMYADGFQYKAELAAGTDLFGGRAHISGSLQYSAADGVRKLARPSGTKNLGSYYSGSTAALPNTNATQTGQTVSTSTGKITCNTTASGLRLPCSVNGYEFGTPGIPTPIFYGTIPAGQTAVAIGCPTCARVSNTAIFGATKDATAFGRFSYKLNNDIVFFTQLSLAQANVFNYSFPMQMEGSRQTTTFFRNNAFLPAATQALLGNNSATNPNWATDGTNTFNVSMWYDDDNRIRTTNNVTRNIISSSGFNGVIFTDWSWNAHFTHGETRLSTTGIHNGNNQFHNAAADAVIENGVLKCWNNTAAAIAQFGDLYPGCVPINVFGRNVSSQAAIDYWGRNTHFAQTNTMNDVAADISGELFDLPAGPLRVAVAGEMRWLDYVIDSNASPTEKVNCYGLRLCGALSTANGHVAQLPGAGFITPANQQYVTQTLWDNNTVPSVQASQSVWEFSAEVGVPILKDIPLIQSLDASLAGRHTDYSISGPVQTWKIGLDWHVNDDLRFRATNSIDIRAPTLNDLFSPATSNSGPFLDPLTNFNPGGIQTVSGGNPNLVPEVARTYTGGVVLTPSFIPGLTISADYYHIKLSNAIANISGSNLAIANLCIASGGMSPFCVLYERPFPYTNTTPANYPTLLRSQLLNAAFNMIEGQDYEVNYGFDLGDLLSDLRGSVNLRAMLNLQPVNSTSNFPGAPISHTTNPKGRASLFGGYMLDNWSVNAQWQWFSGLNKNGVFEVPGKTFYAEDRVRSFSKLDITLTRRFTLDDGTMQAYFNVQNVFNAIPADVYGSASNPGGVNTPAGQDLMGRYFTIGVRGNF
ncbi:MAG TPA: TonB-dependent receptor [Rhizomicrobium sp.]|nr:TonB-dependent receptor [Rhizomicrobium sp.]